MAQPWLLLILRIPPKPDYLRVKIRRRLQAIGCLLLKNTVYVLPDREDCREDFEWVAKEVRELGGEAVLSVSQFLEGMPDAELQEQFLDARALDYSELAAEAGTCGADALARLRRRLEEVEALDFFGAEGRAAARSALAELAARAAAPDPPAQPAVQRGEPSYEGRTWVTRAGIKVDRMASAWLILRFIDPRAQFRFVPAQDSAIRPGELRFDMFEGEFTHEGDRCTFEVLCERFGLRQPGLRFLAEVVHDLDLKDRKFQRPEAAGVGRLIAGIHAAHDRDDARLERACALFDDLLRGEAPAPPALSPEPTRSP